MWPWEEPRRISKRLGGLPVYRGSPELNGSMSGFKGYREGQCDYVNFVWMMSGFSCQSSILTHI